MESQLAHRLGYGPGGGGNEVCKSHRPVHGFVGLSVS